ncbi:DUF397 domain-containing protein [Streptomyces chumphonensis]|uniref:DUF397 domain-containing protein n=1 Tax=Streptomyces chumphonensis TaxID=1214925 RepID=A0A927F1V9_9ACTN|nr:DUF397 domain-containing protein [Streptomyces chumphonensis]MBD3932827.1 DUF397 domain-containing protein [Streptomyces chumphonensis]
MRGSTLSELQWFKSSFSEASGNACVEVAIGEDGQILLRDSVFTARMTKVSRAAFSAFIGHVCDASFQA